MGLIYGNKFNENLEESFVVNEQVILEKFNITKEEILKDPKGTLNKLKHLTDPKENKTDDVSFILYLIGFVSLFVAASVTTASTVVAAGGITIGSWVSGLILDHLNQKGKIAIMSYNKYTKEAKIIKSTIDKEIIKLNKMIKENKNPKIVEKCKKEKVELENILKTYKTYKSEDDYYKEYGYSAEQIKSYKEDIKEFVKNHKDKHYIYNNGDNAIGLYYTGVKQQDFETFIKKYIKDNDGKCYEDDLWEYIEEYDPYAKETIKYLQDNKPIEISNNGAGDSLLYIPNKKVFLYWDHEAGGGIQVDINSEYSYNEILNDAKEYIDKYYKAYIQADAELGYYRLSEPPKGVERKEF